MSRLTKYISKTLSFRLSLKVIGALAFLLVVALCIMFYFSRKALKEEAISDAVQTLEATVNRIDNLLLDVEQSTGNVYFKMMNYFHQPEKLTTYAQRLVDDNPYIIDAHFHWLTDSVTIDTNAVGHIEGFVLCEDSGAGITFLIGIIPVALVALEDHIKLSGLHLRLLKTEEVGIQLFEYLTKTFCFAGTQAIDVPTDEFHIASI